ncbi:kelch like protein [Anaeramoeba ignava]|uniref:Kelch like protein n=1 Tax=Anaeramoeba ignava TaxID=1746090 RepID=A0A9Q0LUN9_ANAIG|nr:kelch like protein [Anaeramoeba ignava]
MESKKTFENYSKLSTDFEDLLHSKNYSDFRIIVKSQLQETKTFECHRAILSSRSDYFHGLFRSQMIEAQTGFIEFEDVMPQVMENLLSYIYSGKLEINSENAVEILVFSSRFCFHDLLDFVTDFINDSLSVDTVIHVLGVADSFGIQIMKEKCMKFIAMNFYDIVENGEFFQLSHNDLCDILKEEILDIPDEYFLFNSLIRWIQHEKKLPESTGKQIQKQAFQLQEKMNLFIPQIRFKDFTEKQLNQVSKTSLLRQEIIEDVREFQKLEKSNQVQKLKEMKQKFKKEEMFILSPRSKFPNSSIIKDRHHIALLREWINDNPFFSKMRLAFSSQRDGAKGKIFHEKCDKQGQALVVILTLDGYIFGGYTKVGFDSDLIWESERFKKEGMGHIKDPDAFLFSLANPKNYSPFKVSPKDDSLDYAVFYHSTKGPSFAGDLELRSDLSSGWTNFGWDYKLPFPSLSHGDESKKIFAGSYDSWKVKVVEVFLKKF